MKTHLKHLVAVTIVLCAIPFVANAKEIQFVNKALVKKSGLEMLKTDLRKSKDPGIVKGALYAAIECKDLYPGLHYSHLLKAVDRVANRSDHPSIAYMAQLTSLYLRNSPDFRVKLEPASNNYDYLFKQVANQIQRKVRTSLSEKRAG